MTEGQSIAKELFDRLEKLGRGTSKAFLASRIDAALAAARAGTGAEKVKSRGMEVAESMIRISEFEIQVVRRPDEPWKYIPLRHRDYDSYKPELYGTKIQRAVAAAIDSERAAAAEAMREACAQTVELQRDCIPLNRDPLEVADMMRVDAARAIRAIPTEGAKP